MVGIVDSDGSSAMSIMGSGTTVYVQLKEERSSSTDQVVEEIRAQTADCAYTVSVSGSNMDLSMLSGGQVVVKAVSYTHLLLLAAEPPGGPGRRHLCW